ncbi:hypothetical protein LEMA_P073260.1 [Plenodomus lingam JN3]|uniref:Secreted protein n=1 Tax=Leptosphaeria maculans (strain JN3 / isolate v23.1.3 / race Av1-4-5-6-7-8) TaxID=985895 RepID=E5A7Z2_LEPMJ|nr:hypothetical protein LEMA_P073260.1 [Plenodomus lingam JN3]CBX99737.1 hypothetical protein LEMA_P073260.1 [Plenodomus lingam JN3]
MYLSQIAHALLTIATVTTAASHVTSDEHSGWLDGSGDVGPGATALVRPFRLNQVHLGEGLLQEKRDQIKDFVRTYDERRFLVLFNKVAGRANITNLSPPGGWEDGGLLSGHWTGHYMSALSQAYIDKGESIFKEKLDWMVAELAACQEAYTEYKQPTHLGYLGALPEDTVLRLGPPRFAVYGSNISTDTWAGWYTQHKIMRGLLDAYYNANNTQALDIVIKMADWAHLALTDTYIAGEFGGANEVFPEIYALTGEEKHLQTAKAFDNRESLFSAAVSDQDILVMTPERKPGRRRRERLHANTHVPQFIGYLRIYEHTGSNEYLLAAKNFFGWVVPHREFASGSTGGNVPGFSANPELFQNRDNIANSIADEGAETCITYNTLNLARNLFLDEHNATYMDHCERGLFNMIAGSRVDTSNNSDPQLTYFQPLSPGFGREYGNTGTCCGGTGMESHTKYQETVYLRSAHSPVLWINLFIPSTLHWMERGFAIKQETNFPREGSTKLTIAGEGALVIKLRVPGWVRNGFAVTINGEAQATKNVQPSTYLSLKRIWKTNDVIEVQMPLSIRTERAIDRPDTQAVMWGPVLLQIVGKPAGGGYWQLSLYRYLKRNGDYRHTGIKQTSETSNGNPLFATTSSNNNSLTLRPYYISDTQPVSSYFRSVEQTVVFGSINTGVPNWKRNDRLPRYDVPVANITSLGTNGPTFLHVLWDQAPFATYAAFVQAVILTTDLFVSARVFTSSERDSIIKQAG